MTFTRDGIVTLALAVSFGGLLTFHVATVFGLFKKRAPGLAALSIAIPPVAVYGGFTHGMVVRAVGWLVFAALYGTAFFLAR